MSVTVTIKTDANKTKRALAKFSSFVRKNSIEGMTRLVQIMKADVVNRVTKPRTGQSTMWGRRPGNMSYTKFNNSSGPPQYPQVLSRMFGGLAQSVATGVYREVDKHVIVGTYGLEKNSRNQTADGFFYPEYHEFNTDAGTMSINGKTFAARAFLGPSLEEARSAIFNIFNEAFETSINQVGQSILADSSDMLEVDSSDAGFDEEYTQIVKEEDDDK